ncbi:hypothetical protein A5731_02135 [Mycolicibacterium conceptionense]|uniref:DUF1707 domain-containing protein n=1 Tax=Mycolicibacterium conceptionense TaxID=451644 RepID=A0A1A1ZIW0_9MYCO|nr:hypothetical protein A5718_09825 [Mycolicibacterium conceptionense]OBF08867.1 hypothetical protein A5731_02135 [Mycolicibacterium conceptionense]OBF25759.1 hypothetical protein A5726_07040 [Mycolicibacterium conceptionense]OBF43470.1 hypothetical protein A5720_12665 [Mycolicibacterium conceptionense]OBH96782.1 hypothetical protein A5716_00685 [Mycolicibacterium conceptionense]
MTRVRRPPGHRGATASHLLRSSSVATRQPSNTRAKDSDRNDTCKVLDNALGEGQLSMEEHRQRVSAATNATTLGDLARLVEDLQTSGAPVQLPTLTKPRLPRIRKPAGSGWGLRLASAAVLVVLGIGIGWGLYGNTPSPLSFNPDPGAVPDGIEPVVLTPPTQLQSLNGVKGLFEQMRHKFGATTGFELHIDPDSALLYRPDPQDSRKKLYYRYTGGWGDPSTDPRNVEKDDRLVDLAAFDYEKVLGIMRGAPDTLNTKRADVKSTWLRITPSEDPATPEAINIAVIVSSDFGGGSIDLYPDGTVKGMYRTNG